MSFQGPQLTNSLPCVFLRFRKWSMAVKRDIKATFSRVFFDQQDCNTLRFLWFPYYDLQKPPVDYQMKTHVFGAKSSPSCAAFVFKMTAEENAVNEKNSVLETVSKNIYVDDLCYVHSCKAGAFA